MPIRIVQVDAFTNRPFAGNPAAICVLPEPRPEQWMRDVAREMNLSETAFLTPRNGEYDLRWLTPSVEVDPESQVRELSPDFTALRKFGGRGIIVTARASSSEFDFVSCFFAPGAGVDEDPVTGSAHTALGPYWSERMGKCEFTAFQAS